MKGRIPALHTCLPAKVQPCANTRLEMWHGFFQAWLEGPSSRKTCPNLRVGRTCIPSCFPTTCSGTRLGSVHLLYQPARSLRPNGVILIVITQDV